MSLFSSINATEISISIMVHVDFSRACPRKISTRGRAADRLINKFNTRELNKKLENRLPCDITAEKMKTYIQYPALKLDFIES